jgi:hypothetical protein
MLNRDDEAKAERRLDRLITKLPPRLCRLVQWTRDPKRIWLRLPLGVVFFLGGFLAILPIFGMWMIPLGLILLAEDVPPARRAIYRLINWTAKRKPRWFGEQPA